MNTVNAIFDPSEEVTDAQRHARLKRIALMAGVPNLTWHTDSNFFMHIKTTEMFGRLGVLVLAKHENEGRGYMKFMLIPEVGEEDQAITLYNFKFDYLSRLHEMMQEHKEAGEELTQSLNSALVEMVATESFMALDAWWNTRLDTFNAA